MAPVDVLPSPPYTNNLVLTFGVIVAYSPRGGLFFGCTGTTKLIVLSSPAGTIPTGTSGLVGVGVGAGGHSVVVELLLQSSSFSSSVGVGLPIVKLYGTLTVAMLVRFLA